jgi:hypothetical protein
LKQGIFRLAWGNRRELYLKTCPIGILVSVLFTPGAGGPAFGSLPGQDARLFTTNVAWHVSRFFYILGCNQLLKL